MNQELKQLREALRRVKYEAASLADAQVIALEALTTSQPAQAGERKAFIHWMTATYPKVYKEYDAASYWKNGHVSALAWQARASLPTQPAAQAEAHPLASRCYTMSESHLSGHRLILGFETMEAAQAAHTWVANLSKPAAQATPEPDTCRKRPRCGRADPCAWLEKQATQQAAGEPVGGGA